LWHIRGKGPPWIKIGQEVREGGDDRLPPFTGDRECKDPKFPTLRYSWLLLAESHLTRRLFGSMVRRLTTLPLATIWGAAAEKQTGRRKEAEAEMYEKPLGIRQLRVLYAQTRQNCLPPRLPELLGMERTKKRLQRRRLDVQSTQARIGREDLASRRVLCGATS